MGKMFANGNHTAIGVSIGWSGAMVLPGEAVPLPIPRLISPYLPPFPRYNRRASVTGFFPMQTDLKISGNAVARINELLATKDNPGLKLRVFIRSGGCSGFQYGFQFDEEKQEDDIAQGGVEVVAPSLESNVRGK